MLGNQLLILKSGKEKERIENLFCLFHTKHLLAWQSSKWRRIFQHRFPANTCKAMWSPASTMAPKDLVSITMQSPPTLQQGWSVWPIAYSRNDGMSLLRLDQKQLCLPSCFLSLLSLSLSLITHSEAAAILWDIQIACEERGSLGEEMSYSVKSQ